MLVEPVAKIFARDRSEGRRAIFRVARFERLGVRDERFRERIVDGVFDDEALCCDATLSVVLKARADRHFRRGLNVRVRKYDIRIRAAEFQNRFFQILAGGRRDRAPRAFASG